MTNNTLSWICMTGLAGLLLSEVTGCGDECTPGRSTSCACPEGAGVQVCGDDGTFGACDCSADPTTSSTGGTGGTGGNPTTSSSTTGGGGEGGMGGMGPMCTSPEIACGAGCVNPNTDPLHCGGCDHDCGTGACTQGFCPAETVAMNQQDVYAIVLDQNDLYFSAADLTFKVFHVNKDGTGLNEVAGNENEPRELALQTGVLYWANFGTSGNNGAIRRETLPSGGEGDLAGNLPVGAWGLAVMGDGVYYAHQNDNAIYKVSISAPAGPQLIASAQGRPWDIAVDTTNVYWTNYDSGEVRRTGINGGQIPAVIANAQGNPIGIAIDATHVYWTTETAGEVKRAPLGGGAEQVIASGQSSPTYLAIDATYVYWANYGNGVVARAPLAGGSVVRLAAGQNGPYHIAVDGTHVYWSTLAGGTVMRTAK